MLSVFLKVYGVRWNINITRKKEKNPRTTTTTTTTKNDSVRFFADDRKCVSLFLFPQPHFHIYTVRIPFLYDSAAVLVCAFEECLRSLVRRFFLSNRQKKKIKE